MHVMLVGFIRTVLNVLATCKRRQALCCSINLISILIVQIRLAVNYSKCQSDMYDRCVLVGIQSTHIDQYPIFNNNNQGLAN